jgi:hypothetical protein
LKTWSHFFHDKTTAELDQKIMHMADQELAKNIESTQTRRSFFYTFFGSVVATTAAAIFWLKFKTNDDDDASSLDFIELAEEDIDLEAIEDLDFFEEWEELDQEDNS